MKKLLFLLFTGLLISVTSCGNSKSDKEAKQDLLTDSLNYYIGVNAGQGSKQQIKYSPDSSKFNQADLLKGVKFIMEADSQDYATMAGVEFGLLFKEKDAMAKSQFNKALNKEIFVAALSSALKEEPNTIKDDSFEGKINTMLQGKTANTDSLSYYYGLNIGGVSIKNIKKLPDAASIKIEEIANTTKSVIENESISFETGLNAGNQLISMVETAKAETKIVLNKEDILKAFEEALKAENDLVDPAQCESKIAEIFQKLKK